MPSVFENRPPGARRAAMCSSYVFFAPLTCRRRTVFFFGGGGHSYAEELCANNADYWMPAQFTSDDNPLAHYTTTAAEIYDQTDGEIDCFIAGAGTGGTINGCGRWFKEKKPSCRIICVEPSESRPLVGLPPELHGVVGIGAGVELPLLEKLAPGQPFEEVR